MRNLHAVLFSAAYLLGISLAQGQEIQQSPAVWTGARRALSATEKFGAYFSVGTVNCAKPWRGKQGDLFWHWQGTGQITLAQDVVTTAFHNFIDPQTCKPRDKQWTCHFQTEFGSFAIDLAQSKFGFSLDPADWTDQAPEQGRCRTERSAFVKDDWAVLKLTQRVKDAVPFTIDEMRRDDVIKTDASFMMISGHTPAFLKDGRQTKSIEKCKHQGASPRGGSAVMPLLLTNCTGGPGTSGSGLYRQVPGDPGSERLIAIYHGPLILPNKRMSLYVPLGGEFLKQLKLVASQ